ncbi:MAG: GNAT family N-acetyltransferase [Thermoplasmata archaeon]|nr:MAG: GNAT family N-acetyltransferase [Thermoplasmata archaeon]
MEPTWTVRTYKEGDEQEIINVLTAAFDGWRGLDYWNWMFKSNADGFYKDLILLADDNGKFAGHYTIIPARMKIGDEIILGSQSVATATHPDYRRQGIFERLANKTYANAAKLGINVTYGFAKVGPSYHGFVKKLDWYHICFLIENERVIDAKEALARHFKGKLPGYLIGILAVFVNFRNSIKGKVKIPKDFTIKQVPAFDDRINDFWKTVSKDYDIMIVKDKRYFEWRLRSPERKYIIFTAEKEGKLIGYMILGEGEEDVRIADLLALPGHDNAITYLVSKAIGFAKERKKDMLRCTLPKDHSYLSNLRKLGFLSTETEMGFIARVNAPGTGLEEKLKSIKNWFITDLDSDHV